QVALLLAALVALAAFALWQLRAPEPLLDLRLLRRRPFAAANAANFFVGAALITAMVDVPLWLATVQGGSGVAGGLLLLRLTAFIPPGAWLGGVLAQRLGVAAVEHAGRQRAGSAAAWITVLRVVGMLVALSFLTHYGLGLFHELTADLALPFPKPG